MENSLTRTLAFISVWSLLCVTGQLQAASEWADDVVPIDLVRELAGDGEFYEGLPGGFPLPDITYLDGIALELVGSWDTGFGSTVFLHTSGDFEEVVNALRDAYAANGWIDVSAPWSIGPPVNVPLLGIRGIPSRFSDSPIAPGPFIGRVPVTDIVRDVLSVYSLCHDQLGTLGFQPTLNSAGGNGIRISYQPVAVSELINPMTCQEKQAYSDAGYPAGQAAFFQTLLPVFELPAGTLRASTTFGGFGFSAVPRYFSPVGLPNLPLQSGQDSRITVPGTNLLELYDHYSMQLEEQGWTNTSSAIASESSSSVWVKTTEGPDIPVPDSSTLEDVTLQAALTLFDSGDDDYQVWFRMTSR